MSEQTTIARAAALLIADGLQTRIIGPEETIYQGISNNSGQTRQGDLFVCKGFTFKPAYLQQAQAQGASAYLTEQIYESNLPALVTENVRKAQSLLAMDYYHNPAQHFCLIGITGTKGKTTTAYDLKGILDAYAQRPTGLFSTVERYVGDKTEPSHLTTPESLDLQACFARAAANGLPYVTMEVSSLAYRQQRVYGLCFDYGLFLNFGPDHISPLEHPTLEDYFSCKLELMRHCKTAVIHRALDGFDRAYAAAKASADRVLVFDLLEEGEDFAQSGLDFAITEIGKEPGGFTFTVLEKGSCEPNRLSLHQEGRFNLQNVLAAICVARSEQIPYPVIRAGLTGLKVPGRMNLISSKDLRVLVDYAHNKMSFEALFASLRADEPNAHLTVVCGVPGERDVHRRTDIGTLCGKWADRIIFTADDPGYERVEEICADMVVAAAPFGKEVQVIADRTAAVETAVRQAPAGGIVLLAGKGSEVTQRVQGKWVYYESDAAIASRMLEERNK